MLKRADIIQCARDCLGTRFRHQGRIPGKGLDCVGLIRWPLVKLLDIDVSFDYRAYGMLPSESEVRKNFIKFFDEKRSLPYPGDIILFRVEDNAQHFAILTYDNTIIHALNSGPKKVAEHGYRYPWPNRLTSVFEYPGVEPWRL